MFLDIFLKEKMLKKDKIACSLGGTESEKQIIARIF